jgi:hypothetical protein
MTTFIVTLTIIACCLAAAGGIFTIMEANKLKRKRAERAGEGADS